MKTNLFIKTGAGMERIRPYFTPLGLPAPAISPCGRRFAPPTGLHLNQLKARAIGWEPLRAAKVNN